jgi:hypothetical protein
VKRSAARPRMRSRRGGHCRSQPIVEAMPRANVLRRTWRPSGKAPSRQWISIGPP